MIGDPIVILGHGHISNANAGAFGSMSEMTKSFKTPEQRFKESSVNKRMDPIYAIEPFARLSFLIPRFVTE
jgi:hypothetical protein